MLRNLLAKFGHEKKPAHVAPEMSAVADASAAAASLYDAGLQQLAAGDLVQAERSFRQALDLRHDFDAAHLALGDVMLASARPEDALDCYQLAVHFSPALPAAHVALATALLDCQRLAEAEASCRQALTLDAASTAAWYCLGNVLKARGELEAAAAAYASAARGNPPQLNALHQLAFVNFRLGRYEDAYREFSSLLQLAPDSPNAHHNFGLLQLETGYAEAALASFTRALELQPATVETLACRGHALRDLRRLDEAIAAYDAALALRPDYGDAISNRAQALLMGGDYTAGWREYERRFAATGTRARSVGAPLWQGETLTGRKIAVLSEQGLGDEIMFASCLPDVLGVAGKVVIECEPRLEALFARSFSPAVVRSRDAGAASRQAAADVEISIGSLPLHFRNSAASFPAAKGYLRADAAAVARWRERYVAVAPPASRRIGIAWRGGTLRNRQRLRSLDLAALAPLLGRSDCAFVSLQYGDCSDELREFSTRHGVSVFDAAHETGTDIDTLAAAIEALDLVITVDNTIAHLSAALGRPTWVLLPYSAEWRYGRTGESVVWYPSMRLFRQSAPRDWTTVIESLTKLLARNPEK